MAAASGNSQPSSPSSSGYRIRGVTQLLLILFGQAIGYAGFILTSLFRDNVLPEHWQVFAGLWFGLGVLVHIGARIAIPYADPLILPIVLALTGLGLATLHAIDLGYPDDTPMLGRQFMAVGIGVAALLVIVFLVKDPRRLKGYPFLLSLASFVLLLLPLVPGLGVSEYGSRIWIRLGSASFQPAEIAKIVLAASFAAYLADKREVLSLAGRWLPRMRDLGPIMVMWGMSLAIMVFENDLGTSLLFFGLFVMMIYVATGKSFWVILGVVAFGAAAAVVMRYASHVQQRVLFWLDPFKDEETIDQATQIIQAQFGLSHGGLLGSGWGLGRPGLIIFSYSDMIAAAVGEEIGIVGLIGVIILYGLLVFRGLKTSLVAQDSFVKLFAAGLSFAFLLQTFAIIAGVTRLLPLTGLTTPFMSQGGSSMVANWILIAGLLIISNQARRPQTLAASEGTADLQQEETQVFSSRVLAQIGRGAIHPVQALAAEQVRLGLDGQVLEEPSETWTGDENLTISIPATIAAPLIASPDVHSAANGASAGGMGGRPPIDTKSAQSGQDPISPTAPAQPGQNPNQSPDGPATQAFNPFADEEVPAHEHDPDEDDFFVRGTE